MRCTRCGFSRMVLNRFEVGPLQTLEMLEKRERLLQKKAAAELDSAKEYTRLGNKRAGKYIEPFCTVEYR